MSSFPGRLSVDRNANNTLRARQAIQRLDDEAEADEIAGPTWRSFFLDYRQFQQADTGRSVAVVELVPRQAIHAVVLKPIVKWRGGAISACTISIGVSGSIAKYLPAFDVYQAVADNVFGTASVFGFERWRNDAEAELVKLYARAVSTGANLDKLVSGEAELRILMSMIP